MKVYSVGTSQKNFQLHQSGVTPQHLSQHFHSGARDKSCNVDVDGAGQHIVVVGLADLSVLSVPGRLPLRVNHTNTSQ